MDNETPKYKIIEYKGAPAREYPNGAIRDDHGRLLAKPQYIMQHSITPESAIVLKNRRKELMLEAVEKGLMRATDAPSPYEAVAHLIHKRAEVAMSDMGRAGNEAAKIVMEAIDAYQDRKVEQTHVERHEYVVDEETQKMILEIMGNRQAVEGTVVDAERSTE